MLRKQANKVSKKHKDQKKKHNGKIASQANGSKIFILNNSFSHPKVQAKMKCTECEKSFKEKTAFVKHLKIHSGERPYKCLTCGKNFTKKSSLVIHQRIHNRSKPFPCSICGKTFDQKSSLLIHNKTHIKKASNNKSLPCVSKHPGHTERHRAEKSYRCLECKKMFVLHKNLIKHQKTHANVMPQSPKMGIVISLTTKKKCCPLVMVLHRKGKYGNRLKWGLSPDFLLVFVYLLVYGIHILLDTDNLYVALVALGDMSDEYLSEMFVEQLSL